MVKGIRPRISWMTQADNRILESLQNSGLILSAQVLAANTDYSRNYINQRMSILYEEGLVDRVDEGLYQITDLGQRYLEANLTDEELEKLEDLGD